MDYKYAAVKRSQFLEGTLKPLLVEVIKSGKLDEELQAELAEALRISRAPGKAGPIGATYAVEVLTAIMLTNLLPKRKAKKAAK